MLKVNSTPAKAIAKPSGTGSSAPRPASQKASTPASARGESVLVKATGGNRQRRQRGRTLAKQQYERLRLSGSLIHRRIRKILQGALSPAEALASLFATPSALMASRQMATVLLLPDSYQAPQQGENLLDVSGFHLAV